jgi:hypothetical protein
MSSIANHSYPIVNGEYYDSEEEGAGGDSNREERFTVDAEKTDEFEKMEFWNLWTILKYVIYNYEKFLLLLLVFLIVYAVDYISNVNAIIVDVSKQAAAQVSQS